MRLFLLLCALTLSAAAEARTIEIPVPPASLAKWYPPKAKRLVWLHNMFELRRGIQAIEEYAALQDQPHLDKWTRHFMEHYRKIGEMVPEWKDELDMQQADKLSRAVKNGDFASVTLAAHKVGQSCKGCHEDYRAVVTALYRSPDFSQQKIRDAAGKPQKFETHMKSLARNINRIKIAVEDGRGEAALDAFTELDQGITGVADTCGNCHKKPEFRAQYFGEKLHAALARLKTSIQSGDQRKTYLALGGVAITACAGCHGTHRTLYQLRKMLNPRQTAPQSGNGTHALKKPSPAPADRE